MRSRTSSSRAFRRVRAVSSPRAEPAELGRGGVLSKGAQRCFRRARLDEIVFVQVSAEDAPELWKRRRGDTSQRFASGYEVST